MIGNTEDSQSYPNTADTWSSKQAIIQLCWPVPSPYSSSSSFEGYFKCHPSSPHHLYPPHRWQQYTSLPSFALLLPLNRLLRNLFKYFDISPLLTARAEMICDRRRWVSVWRASSNTHPRALFLPPPKMSFYKDQFSPPFFSTAPPVNCCSHWKQSSSGFLHAPHRCHRQTVLNCSSWSSFMCF